MIIIILHLISIGLLVYWWICRRPFEKPRRGFFQYIWIIYLIPAAIFNGFIGYYSYTNNFDVFVSK